MKLKLAYLERTVSDSTSSADSAAQESEQRLREFEQKTAARIEQLQRESAQTLEEAARHHAEELRSMQAAVERTAAASAAAAKAEIELLTSRLAQQRDATVAAETNRAAADTRLAAAHQEVVDALKHRVTDLQAQLSALMDSGRDQDEQVRYMSVWTVGETRTSRCGL